MLSRTTVAETRGGASKLVRPALKHPYPFHPPASHPLPPPPPRHASARPSWRRSLNAFVESVYSGTFNALKSGVRARPPPYAPSRLEPLNAGARFAHSLPRLHRAAPPRPRFGPSPRPALGHTSSRTGLGAARQFSSAGFGVWDNVVHNVPLALRAVADQWDQGIDARKWRKARREIHALTRTGGRGEGRAPVGFDERADKSADFAQYFTVPAAVVVDEAHDEPVTLILAVDPDFELAVPASSSSPSDEAERLLSPSLLDSLASVTAAYTTHSHRLRTITNRLSAAGLLDPHPHPHGGASSELGVLDPARDGVDEEHRGRRVWRVSFRDRLVTRSTVETVVRGRPGGFGERECRDAGARVPHWAEKVQRWTGRDAVDAGEGEWWWLVGGRGEAAPASALSDADVFTASPPLPASLLASPAASTPSYPDSSSGYSVGAAYAIDAAAALAVAQTFVLPSPASACLSSSSSYSSASTPTTESGYEDTGECVVVWDSLSTSLTETDDGMREVDDPAASAWAESIELVGGAAAVDAGVVSAGSGSYEDGVRTFLSEVEGERERRFVEGMVFV